ncbi:MAG: endonuclease/exonuclease/phosphatase family protein [Deltaproteobacteria bacterium]|nr:endonuclease/exonuclease/phosphatase family protein [Deltaproteobacteria bacterium]
MSQRSPLRVLNLNMHKGFSSFNRRFVLNEMREAIRSSEADLVFLQEVIGEHKSHQKNHKNWPVQTQYEFLADSIWHHHAYGQNAVYLDGHHGNALLSKFPITFWKNIDISCHAFESRGFLHCVIEIPETREEIHCLCTHLGLFDYHRKKQYQMMSSYIQKNIPEDAAIVLAGDFNDWLLSSRSRFAQPLGLLEVFESVGSELPRSFPSWLPLLKLDRIFCRGFKVLSAQTLSGKIWAELSDHKALLAEIQR